MIPVIKSCIVAIPLAGIGYIAPRYLPHTLLNSLLDLGFYVIGFVGACLLFIYKQLITLTETTGLDHREHSYLEEEVSKRCRSFHIRVVFSVVLVCVLFLLARLTDDQSSTPSWIFGVFFVVLGFAGLFIKSLYNEQEEIREFKSYAKKIERREKERMEQVKKLKEGLKGNWESDRYFSK